MTQHVVHISTDADEDHTKPTYCGRKPGYRSIPTEVGSKTRARVANIVSIHFVTNLYPTERICKQCYKKATLDLLEIVEL